MIGRRVTAMIMAIMGILFLSAGIAIYSITKQPTGTQKKIELSDVSIAGGILLLFAAIILLIIHTTEVVLVP